MPLVDPGVRENLADAAIHEIIDALNRTGRFQIGLGDAIGVWINQQGVKREDVLAGKGLDAAAERFKVDNLMIVAFSRVQNKPYMDVRLFSFPGASSRLNTALFVPATVKPAAKGDYSAAGKQRDSQTPNQQRSFLARLLYGELDAGTYSSGETAIPLKEVAKFPFIIGSMDVAVGSKDHIARMVITDGEQRLALPDHAGACARAGVDVQDRQPRACLQRPARRAVERRRRARAGQPLQRDPGDPRQLADPDDQGPEGVRRRRGADGHPVCRRRERRRREEDALGAVVRPDGFLQAGRRDADGPAERQARLRGQGARVPSNFRATGATYSNIAGKGLRALAFIDEYNRLRIAIDNQDVFRTSAPVGTGMGKLGVETQIERGGRTYVYSPEPMPLAVDLDGDGIEEIVVPQNQIPGRLAVVYKGPAGYRFQTVNSGFEGTVMALGAVPGDGGPPSLVAAVVRYTNFRETEGETQIIMTTSE